MVEMLEMRLHLHAPNLSETTPGADELAVTLGGAPGSHSATFVDVDGTANTITFKSKSASTTVVTLAGSRLTAISGKTGVIVSGPVTGARSITVAPADGTGDTLTIRSKGGDGKLTAGLIDIAGSIRSISANTVDLQSASEMQDVLSISGSVAKLRLGSVFGDWMIVGDAGSIRVGSTAAATSATFGNVGTLTVAGDALCDISARSIKTMNVTGNYEATSLTLTLPIAAESLALGRLTVGGSLNGVTIRSDSSIGTISTGKLLGGSVYAGMSPTFQSGLPTKLEDFVSSASVLGLTVRSSEARSFSNACVTARYLGKIRLGGGRIDTDNATSFGIAADRIASVSLVDGNGKAARIKNLDDPDAALIKIGRLRLKLGLFEIRLRFFGVAV